MNLEQVCNQTIEVTLDVAKFLKSELGKVKAQEIEFKQLNHLVSYVDKVSEEKLIEGLGKLLPDAAFLAEEETVAHDNEKDWLWIIDPLDGTTNFLHQLPFFAISIALQYKGKTVLGVVHEVNNDETFYSWEGASAAFLNKKSIQVSPTTTLEQSLLATGFPYYDFEHINNYLEMIKPLMLGTRGLRRIGSAALDLAYVACGRYEGYFEYSLSPWDVAAGAFIVQQAGGLVGDFSGGEDYIFGKEIVAGNPAIYKQLIDSTIKHFK
jgi:myo-inositol-1(or 4)-monophosphatase